MPGETEHMNPLVTIPKDGTLIRLFVDYSSDEAHGALEDDNRAWTIGFNQLKDTGEDHWQIAGWDWSHDCFTEGSGEILGWLPFFLEEAGENWRDDPSRDERWNAGLDYAMDQLCKALKVDPATVTWDAATETLDGDVRAVLGNIFAKAISTNWKSEPESFADAYAVQVAALDFAKEWEHESSSAYRAAEAAFIAGHEFKPPQPVELMPEKPKEYFTIEEYKIWKGIDPDKPVWYGSYWCFGKWSDAQEVLDLLEKNSGGKALLRIAPSHVAKESPPTTGLGIGEYLLREFYSGSAPIRRACWPTGDHISTDSAEGGTLWYYSADEDELTKDYKLDFHDLAASDWEIIDEGTILR